MAVSHAPFTRGTGSWFARALAHRSLSRPRITGNGILIHRTEATIRHGASFGYMRMSDGGQHAVHDEVLEPLSVASHLLGTSDDEPVALEEGKRGDADFRVESTE